MRIQIDLMFHCNLTMQSFLVGVFVILLVMNYFSAIISYQIFPPDHLCAKMSASQLHSYVSLRLHSFTYVRKSPERDHPNKFDLLLLADGKVYVLDPIVWDKQQPSGVLHQPYQDPVLKLRMPHSYKPWKEYFGVEASISDSELSSLYAFNKETPYHQKLKEYKHPGYHLAIRTTTENEYILSQTTKDKVKPTEHKAYLQYSLILDELNNGYAMNVDYYEQIRDVVLYGFHYQIDSDQVHSNFGLGEAKLHRLNAKSSERQDAPYFYLETSGNPNEVRFIPRHKRIRFYAARSLLHKSPVGFIATDKNAIKRMYLFDPFDGCVFVVQVPSWEAMMYQYKAGESFSQPMSVMTFEQMLDCPNSAEQQGHFTQNRCLSRWPVSTSTKSTTSTTTEKEPETNAPIDQQETPEEWSPDELSTTGGEQTEESRMTPTDAAFSTSKSTKAMAKRKKASLLMQMGIYSWFLVTIVGAICLCSFPIVMAISVSCCSGTKRPASESADRKYHHKKSTLKLDTLQSDSGSESESAEATEIEPKDKVTNDSTVNVPPPDSTSTPKENSDNDGSNTKSNDAKMNQKKV